MVPRAAVGTGLRRRTHAVLRPSADGGGEGDRLPEPTGTRSYLASGYSGTIDYVHDRELSFRRPYRRVARDTGRFDCSVSTDKPLRWSKTYGGRGRDVSLSGHDVLRPEGVHLQDPAARVPRTVGGQPVVRIWVETTAEDVDFFVYTEEIGSNGSSRYLSEGVLRVSNRATVPALRRGGPAMAPVVPVLRGDDARFHLLPVAYRRVFWNTAQ